MECCIESRKRVRDDSNDSFFNCLGSKVVRVDSINSDVISPVATKSIDSEQIGTHADISILDAFQATAIQEDLLKILDETDASTDRDPAIQGLDSVIRSFEKEIHVASTTPVMESSIEVVSESRSVSQPELGYLLEASDDELGLPPADIRSEKEKIEAGDFAASMKGFLGLEDEVPNYWMESFSCSEKELNESESEDVVTLGGLFDFDHTDITVGVEFPRRSETMFCL